MEHKTSPPYCLQLPFSTHTRTLRFYLLAHTQRAIMSINNKQRKALKAKAHHLKPVIRIGQHGVSEGVIAETNIALDTHELIKVQIQQGERAERHSAIEALCQQTEAELVHAIGKVFIIYRQLKEPFKK